MIIGWLLGDYWMIIGWLLDDYWINDKSKNRQAVVQAGRFLREDQGAVGDAVKAGGSSLRSSLLGMMQMML